MMRKAMALVILPLTICAAVAQDHPEADWVAALRFTKGKGTRGIKYMVMHTVEGSYKGCISWFLNPKVQASAHYVVGYDGRVTQMVRDDDIAWHAGDWEYNKVSIGIEHEGWAAKNGWTMAMYKASAAISRRICLKYGIPMDREHIISHQKITPKRRYDPGPHFDWDLYIDLVNQKEKKAPARGSESPGDQTEEWWKAAGTYESQKRYYDAAAYYRKVAYGEAGELSDRALARLKEFEKDPKIAAAIEQEEVSRECRSWMSIADTYRNNGLLGDSIPLYERITSVHPGTSAARRAQDKIDEVNRILREARKR